MLRVRIPLRARGSTLCDSLSVTCDRSMFFRAHRFPPPNKADRPDITEILFKVVLSTINQTKANPSFTMRIMASRLFCDSLFLELVHMSFKMAQIVNSGKTCLRKCIFIDLYTLVSDIITSGSHLSESE